MVVSRMVAQTTRRGLINHAYWFIPALIALVFGLTGIATNPFWDDELYTADAIENGMEGLWAHNWEAPLIPYYFLMYLWTFDGQLTLDWWMRLLSVAFAVAAVILTARAGKHLTGRSAGFVAAVVVALSPSLNYYGHHARNYTLGTFLVAAASAVALRHLRDEPQGRVWWDLVLIVSAACLLVQTALIVLVVLTVALPLLPGGRPHLRSWLRSVAAATPVVLIAVLLFFVHGPTMHGWVSKPDPSDLWGALPAVPRGYVFALTVLSVAVLTRIGWVWLAGLVAAVAAVYLVSHIGASFWHDGVLGMLMPTLGLAASGFVVLTTWRIAAVWCAFLLVVSTPALLQQQTSTISTRIARQFAQTLAAKGTTVRLVGSPEPFLRFAVRHYTPHVTISYFAEGEIPTTPYWSLKAGGDNCPGAIVLTMNPKTTLTYCP